MNWQLDKEQWLKIGKGLLISLAGAAATYLTTLTTGMSFGVWTPLIVTGFSILANYLRKVANGEQL
jgi:hypothetical protein